MANFKIIIKLEIEVPSVEGASASDAEILVKNDLLTRFMKDAVITITECTSESM